RGWALRSCAQIAPRSHDYLFGFDILRPRHSTRFMELQAPSAKSAAAERTSAIPRPLDRMSRRRAALFDVLAAAGIRINPALPDPWDILVKDENQFVRRIMSPLNNGLTALGDMYVEGIWDCQNVSEFFYRALVARLNSRLTWCVPNVLQY